MKWTLERKELGVGGKEEATVKVGDGRKRGYRPRVRSYGWESRGMESMATGPDGRKTRGARGAWKRAA